MLRTLTLAVALNAALLAGPLAADPGKPVAVRWWGQGMVSIETYWNLTVVVDPYSRDIGYEVPQIGADLVLVTHEHPDHNNVGLVEGDPTVMRGLDDQEQVREIHHTLDRLPNTEEPQWQEAATGTEPSPHAITVTSIPAWHDNSQGSERGAVAMFLIEVDGLRIVHCGDIGQHQFTDEQLAAMGRVDCLLIPVGGVYTVDGRQAAKLVEQVEPRVVVPIHYKTEALKIDLQGRQPFVTALGEQYDSLHPPGNTLALCSVRRNEQKKPVLAVLNYTPWSMPSELFSLFEKKEAASNAAQEVFKPLSAEQMNFQPNDGTHTPRWNAEHMMGTELHFFSQIYSRINPAIPHLRLNPAQMPPDYQAAHPDWDGAEEARQIERVSNLTRRFAYLLDGLSLDEEAPGSRWTPRGLLEQMERHYKEHTANVKQKFELPDWPEK